MSDLQPPSMLAAFGGLLFSRAAFVEQNERQVLELNLAAPDLRSYYAAGTWPTIETYQEWKRNAVEMRTVLRTDLASTLILTVVLVLGVVLGVRLAVPIDWSLAKIGACTAAALALWAGLFQMRKGKESWGGERLDEVLRGWISSKLAIAAGAAALVAALIAQA